MEKTWQQKGETINRLSSFTVSLEGSSFPSGSAIFHQVSINLYVVLSVSVGKTSFFSLPLIPDCVFSQTSEESKREMPTQ